MLAKGQLDDAILIACASKPKCPARSGPTRRRTLRGTIFFRLPAENQRGIADRSLIKLVPLSGRP